MGYNKELLSQIIDNLSLIKDNDEPFSAITKDIILQNLRDAYLEVLKAETEDFIKDTENQIATNIEDKSLPEIVEDSPNVKSEEILDKKEEIEPEITIVEDKDEEISVEDEVEEEIEESDELQEELIQTKEEQAPSEEPEILPEMKVAEEETIEEMDNDILQFLIPEVKEEPKKEEPEKVAIEPEVEEDEEISKEEKPQEPTLFPDEPVVVETAPQQRSLNDLFNEQKKDNSLSSKFQQTKVVDLTKAISINDKFLFIRELFKNRSEEFSRAIQTLNNCENIEEAFDVMEGLKKHYFWDSTSSAYLTLCDLVRRKF